MEHCSSSVGEANDCSVIALAIVCNTDYECARSALTDAGREVGQGADLWQIHKAANILGFKIIKLENFIEDMIRSYPVSKRTKYITTYHPKRFKKYWLGVPTLLLSCDTHIVAFRFGIVHDWSANYSEIITDAHIVLTIGQKW